MRIGHGFDVHAFTAGDHIILGGVHIPHKFSLKAHSDGDVVLHAMCDALLGATGQGDIGRHFPDDNPEYKDIDSRILLKQVYAMVTSAGYELVNADITVIAQSPKLSNYIESMCVKISDVINVNSDQINIKATTTEYLGYIGRQEGIAVHAVVLLEKT